MEILAGEMKVLLPGEATWQTIQAGHAFESPAQSKFTLRIIAVADYCCSDLK